MRTALIILLLLPLTFTHAQRIGKLAPEPKLTVFPDNAWGVDLMFGEGGFGLGTFYKKSFTQSMSGFIDFSISESKDEREIEYIDYYGNVISINKKNRVFLLPLNAGAQFRLFENSLSENLRPFISFAVGPTLVVTTPYEKEFFSSFGKATTRVALGGYAGFGANFGLSTTSYLGLNIRYYYTHLFGSGVENLFNRYKNDLEQFTISLSLGMMF